MPNNSVLINIYFCRKLYKFYGKRRTFTYISVTLFWPNSYMQNQKLMTEQELQSKTITFLRYPLIVGVVFIHSNIIAVVNADLPGQLRVSEWIQTIITLFSNILPSICVPLFFFISGFLFFYRSQEISSKLKKRIHTLLIPYLIWNLFGILSIIISHFVMPEYTKWSQWSELSNAIINIFLPLDFPPNRPFWFIRNLLYIMLLTPLIKFLFTGKHRIALIIPLFLCWIFNSTIGLIDNKLITAFLFFSAGSYFSLNKLNFVYLLNKLRILSFIAYPIFIISIPLLEKTVIGNYIYSILICIGIVSTINLTALIIKKRGIQIPPLLTESSFFIFALHGLLISKFIKLCILVFQPQSPFYLLIIYFFIPVFTISISLIIYYLLKKTYPQLTNVLIGERSKSKHIKE